MAGQSRRPSAAWLSNSVAGPAILEAADALHDHGACFETRPPGAPQHEVDLNDGIKKNASPSYVRFQ
jgi:hypothetical protein